MAAPSSHALVFLKLLDFHLEDFREYRKQVEVSLQTRLDRIADLAKDLDPHGQDEYFDSKYDEIAQARDNFPQLLRSTTLVALYSLLEHQLFKVCNHLKKTEKLTLTHNDLRGEGIVQAQRFIKIACKKPFPDGESQWQMIQHVRRIRNCLVHGGGVAPNDGRGKNVRNAVKDLEGIALNEFSQVVLEERLLDNFMVCLKKFLQDVATTNL